MNEAQRNLIKSALLKCAKENKNRITPTFNVVVSSVCRSAVERIEELEKENAEAKELLLELYDCIPASMTDLCRETLQKVALFFKDEE